MVAGNICTIPDGVPLLISQAIPNVNPSGQIGLSAWLCDHSPWILGSALGMFASNIFLYALRNGDLGALQDVSLNLPPSLPRRIRLIAIAAPPYICRTYAWTSQLARHVYLLALCTLCQAVILPCLVGSQLLGWAGLAWFGALRVLCSAFRIVFKVVFDTLVVYTGLDRVFVVASKTVTSYVRWMWDWTTDLHDAAVTFVGGPQSTLSPFHSVSASSSVIMFSWTQQHISSIPRDRTSNLMARPTSPRRAWPSLPLPELHGPLPA